MKRLTLIDESVSGPGVPAGTLTVPESWLTAREIIRRRVLHEVATRTDGQRPVDAGQQVQAAVRAFERNGFLMFVDGRQVLELDEVVEFTEDVEVSFLKLVALAGG